MASTNHSSTSFTITQSFLGAPLQFNPALGSRELEQLIDAFVTGSSSKQEKFSEITIDFYNNATVDLNTGALVKIYHVYPMSEYVATSPWDFDQSPTQSQSSGFSPAIFTPSPGSSAAYLGDSGYGSISSLTPPNRNRDGAVSGRVAKKPKKETKKTAEIRLPGFSIMTKDGIDVTNSAGRGTKTKEQREHAHLMRIMKACDSCKRKKIKCDPSHQRSHNDMSRTSTSTTHTSSSSSSSSSSGGGGGVGRPNPSPPISIPSLSRETTNASLNSMPAFGNIIDDFVLFPEDTGLWNIEAPLPEDYDLSQFNFDINDIGGQNEFSPMNTEQYFYSSFDQRHSSFQFGNQLSQSLQIPNQHSMPQYDDPQSCLSVAHSRPHPSTSPQDSSQPDSNRRSQDGFVIPTPTSASTFADSYSSDGIMSKSYIANGPETNDSPSSFSSADWSTLESSVNANTSPQVDGRNHYPGLSQANSMRQVRGLYINSPVERTAMHDLQEEIQAPTEHASLRRLGESGGSMNVARLQHPERDLSGSGNATRAQLGQNHVSRITSGLPGEILGLANICTLVSESLRSVRSAPAEYISLSGELQRLRTVLTQVKSGMVADNVLGELKNYTGRLQALHTHVKELVRLVGQQDADYQIRYLRQCQEQARRFIRSLCATIQSLYQGVSPNVDDTPLTSRRNTRIHPSISAARRNDLYWLSDGIQVMNDSSSSGQNSSSLGGFSISMSSIYDVHGRRIDPGDEHFDHASRVGFAESQSAQGSRLAATAGTLVVSTVPQYSILVKDDSVALDIIERRLPQPDSERIIAVTQQDRHRVLPGAPSFNEGIWQSMGLSAEFAPDHYADWTLSDRDVVHQTLTGEVQPPVQDIQRSQQTEIQTSNVVSPLSSRYMGNSDENATMAQSSSNVGTRSSASDVASSVGAGSSTIFYSLLALLTLLGFSIVAFASSFSLSSAPHASHNENQQNTKYAPFIRALCTSWTSSTSSSLIEICRLAVTAMAVAQAPRIVNNIFGSINSLSRLTVLSSVMTFLAIGERGMKGKGALSISRHESEYCGGAKRSMGNRWLGFVRELSLDGVVV